MADQLAALVVQTSLAAQLHVFYGIDAGLTVVVYIVGVQQDCIGLYHCIIAVVQTTGHTDVCNAVIGNDFATIIDEGLRIYVQTIVADDGRGVVVQDCTNLQVQPIHGRQGCTV